MEKKIWKRKFNAAVLCGVLGLTLQVAIQPLPVANAGLVGVFATAIQGAAVYKQVDTTIKHYNETEQGRQELFAEYQKKYGVSEDYYRQEQLDEMMYRLTEGIALVDPSIHDKPYLYFINKQKSFNAFCSMGHVMSVNEGLYSMTDNQDEVAVVLAHEMVHGQKDHVASAMRKKLNVAVGAAMVGSAVGGSTLTNLALNIAVNQIDSVSITKKDEWEADNLAFDYVINAGYNPGATAALWQRVEEKSKKSKTSFAGEIFSPSDHPTHQQRRENYIKKLYEYSGQHATVEKGAVKVNGKALVKPVAANDMSGAERSYFVLGNLAAAYHNGHNKSNAYASGNTLMLGEQPIMVCEPGDPSASELATLLNSIK
jgi:predicted Zn-dependent protease